MNKKNPTTNVNHITFITSLKTHSLKADASPVGEWGACVEQLSTVLGRAAYCLFVTSPERTSDKIKLGDREHWPHTS